MKELYISPELEILCFAPVENIAAAWAGADWTDLGATGDNFQTSAGDATYGDDYTEGVDTEGL